MRHPIPFGKDTHTGNSAWLLTDYSKAHGALAVVPGSHWYARQPNLALRESVDHAIPIEAPAGSLVVWNGNLWHGAFPRTTPGLRLPLTMYFNRSYLQVQEDYRSMVTPEILQRNPKRFATLIGLANPDGWTSWQGPDHAAATQLLAEAAEEARVPSPQMRVVT